MFFFVWSNDGGPLQYIGLALFFLQFISVSFPSLLQHAWAIGIVIGLAPTCYVPYWMYREGLTLGQVRDLAVQRARGVVNNASNAIAGTVNGGNGNNNGIRPQVVLLLVGLIVVFVSVIASALESGNASALAGLFQFAAIGMMMHTMRHGMDRRGGGGSDQQGSSSNTLSGIIDLVASMPVEEYVAEDSYDKCSISQLKKMLEIRHNCNGNTAERNSSQNFVEKRELVDEVKRRRKCSDSCIICFEEYNAGDPIRVLPKCGHEFHVECVDQWAYTYASSANRRNQQPSCPLCKVALK